MGAPVGEDTLLGDSKARWGKSTRERERRELSPGSDPPRLFLEFASLLAAVTMPAGWDLGCPAYLAGEIVRTEHPSRVRLRHEVPSQG